jgi:AcrR family transcriptional regulator
MVKSVQIHAPKQKRSEATLRRLLDAAEVLLAEKKLDEITVADVVARAASSVGSFYARFPGKEALVAALIARYHEDAATGINALAADPKFSALPLAGRASRFIHLLVATCQSRRGLLRLRLELRLRGSIHPQQEEERSKALADAIASLFDPVKHEIRHRDRDRALTFALRMADAMAMTVLVEEVSGSFGSISNEEIVERLTEAIVSYLT